MGPAVRLVLAASFLLPAAASLSAGGQTASPSTAAAPAPAKPQAQVARPQGLVADAPEPEIHADRTTTFRYVNSGATNVALAMDARQEPMPMTRDSGGTWTITTAALSPEWYSYHFVVDGQNALDPKNATVLASYLASGNGFLVPASEPWQKTGVPHGTVHHHTYTSAVVEGLPERQSEFYVYTPPGYDARTPRKYPVLYLLHGWSDTAAGWTNIGHADWILDNLIAVGKAKPMIVVMPLGYGDMSFVQSGHGVWQQPATVDHNTSLFEQALQTEVIPQVERLYNVSARREDRAIAGLSMGGLEALTVGLHHADQFAYVGGFSAAVHLLQPAFSDALDPNAAKLKLLYIGCGTADSLYQPNLRLEAALRARGFNPTTTEIPGGLHTWLVWRPELVDFASAIFR